jgi:hypothetical protein
MSSDSITFATRATTGSYIPRAADGDVEYEPKDTTSSPHFVFATPSRFVERDESTESLESPPRKKHRSDVSSYVDSNRAALDTTVSHLDFQRDDAWILASLDLSSVPNDEFILARPNQVRNNFEIEYPNDISRPRTVSISSDDTVSLSSDDADTYPITSLQDSESMEDPTNVASILSFQQDNRYMEAPIGVASILSFRLRMRPTVFRQ